MEEKLISDDEAKTLVEINQRLLQFKSSVVAVVGALDPAETIRKNKCDAEYLRIMLDELHKFESDTMEKVLGIQLNAANKDGSKTQTKNDADASCGDIKATQEPQALIASTTESDGLNLAVVKWKRIEEILVGHFKVLKSEAKQKPLEVVDTNEQLRDPQMEVNEMKSRETVKEERIENRDSQVDELKSREAVADQARPGPTVVNQAPSGPTVVNQASSSLKSNKETSLKSNKENGELQSALATAESRYKVMEASLLRTQQTISNNVLEAEQKMQESTHNYETKLKRKEEELREEQERTDELRRSLESMVESMKQRESMPAYASGSGPQQGLDDKSGDKQEQTSDAGVAIEVERSQDALPSPFPSHGKDTSAAVEVERSPDTLPPPFPSHGRSQRKNTCTVKAMTKVLHFGLQRTM
jgi:hypothetical protein